MTFTREMWRQRWLDSINELTSLDLQNKTWLDKENTNPHWSFVEFRCCYFDDLLCDYDYKYYIETDWITKEEYEIIKEWHNELDNYKAPNDYDHTTILNDKKWLNILNMGVEAKYKLLKILPEVEKEILE